MNNADKSQIDILNSDDLVCSLMGESGVSAAILTVNIVAQVAYEIMVYQVLYKRTKELQEIRKGLDVLQLATLLNSHPKLSSLMFPTVDEASIDVHLLRGRVTKHATTVENTKNITAYNFLLDYFDNVCKRTDGKCTLYTSKIETRFSKLLYTFSSFRLSIILGEQLDFANKFNPGLFVTSQQFPNRDYFFQKINASNVFEN